MTSQQSTTVNQQSPTVDSTVANSRKGHSPAELASILQRHGFFAEPALVHQLVKIAQRYQRRHARKTSKASHQAHLQDLFKSIRSKAITYQACHSVAVARLALEGWQPGDGHNKTIKAFRKARAAIPSKAGRVFDDATFYLLNALCLFYRDQTGKLPPSGYSDDIDGYVGAGFHFIHDLYQHITGRYIDPKTLGRYLADEKSRINMIFND